MREITPQQLKDYLQVAAPAPLLLDVREPWEYEICHIEGARLMPMQQIPQTFKALDPQQEIVVICHHGRRSLQVAGYLERMGFTRLINLTGGVDAWSHDVDRSMPTY